MFELALGLVAAVLVLALFSLRWVPEGRAYTVHRLGRFSRSIGPGLHWVLPLVERVRQRVDLIGHRIDLAPTQPGAAHAAVFYQIIEPERAGASLDAVDDFVQHEADDILTAVAADQPEAIGALCENLKLELNRRLAPRGLRITRCQLQAA